VANLGPGDYFGETALIAKDKRGATVTARTKMVVLSLDQKAFNNLFGANRITFAKRNAIRYIVA
jgi:CRP-like cAMP-binding protein